MCICAASASLHTTPGERVHQPPTAMAEDGGPVSRHTPHTCTSDLTAAAFGASPPMPGMPNWAAAHVTSNATATQRTSSATLWQPMLLALRLHAAAAQGCDSLVDRLGVRWRGVCVAETACADLMLLVVCIPWLVGSCLWHSSGYQRRGESEDGRDGRLWWIAAAGGSSVC